jgi:hypothetical protein
LIVWHQTFFLTIIKSVFATFAFANNFITQNQKKLQKYEILHFKTNNHWFSTGVPLNVPEKSMGTQNMEFDTLFN